MHDKLRSLWWIYSRYITRLRGYLPLLMATSLVVVYVLRTYESPQQTRYSNLDYRQQSFNAQIILWGLPVDRERNVWGTKGLFDYLDSFKNPCWRDNTTSKLRCLPYFYQLGVGKSGTTTLYTELVQHPDIVPAKRKEVFFWNSVINRKNFQTYLEEFSEAANVINKGVDKNGFHNKITLDATPAYFTSFGYITSIPGNVRHAEPLYTLPHTLYALNPHTKFVVLLRNPVDRLYSHYYHFHHKTASAEEFHDLVINATQIMSECLRVRTIRSCLFDYKLNIDIAQKRHITLHYSLYYAHAREWLSVFPRKQFVFIKAEDLYTNPIPVLKQVFKFLELDDLSKEKYRNIKRYTTQYRGRKKEEMSAKTRKILEDFFEPFNIMLARMLHDKRFNFA